MVICTLHLGSLVKGRTGIPAIFLRHCKMNLRNTSTPPDSISEWIVEAMGIFVYEDHR